LKIKVERSLKKKVGDSWHGITIAWETEDENWSTRRYTTDLLIDEIQQILEREADSWT